MQRHNLSMPFFSGVRRGVGQVASQSCDVTNQL